MHPRTGRFLFAILTAIRVHKIVSYIKIKGIIIDGTIEGAYSEVFQPALVLSQLKQLSSADIFRNTHMIFRNIHMI